MKTTVNVLAIVFLLLGLVFTILPLGTIALLPIVLAILFAAIAFCTTKGTGKKLSRAVIIIGMLLVFAVIVKVAVVEDKVAPTTEQEQQKKEQSEQENLKDLEDLE